MRNFFDNNKADKWFLAFLAIAVILFFTIPIMSLDAGNSGDEDPFQIPQGNHVMEWFLTFGEDTTNFTFENLRYYGSSPDVVMAFFNKAFNIDNIHISRHIFNSLFGWLSMVFAGLIAFRIAGWRAAVFAMVFLFLSPRFLGHSFNNPKDIPFAAGIAMAVFFMLQFFRQFPKVKKITIVFLVLSIALAISVRIGGILLFGYFGLFGLLFFIKEILDYKKQHKKITLKKATEHKFKTIFKPLFFYGLGICVAGYFLGLILWPYALQAPIRNPIAAFQLMSDFNVNIRQVWAGERVWSNLLPWYYTPKFILMTTPFVVILGALIYPFFGGLKKQNHFTTFVVCFCFLFPVLWMIYSNANVYGGWRHSLFVAPFMTVAAGLGFNALVGLGKRHYQKILLTILPFALLLPAAVFTVKSHPYQYVYFNRLVGGVQGAFGRFELDYYYHSTREASEWVIANAEKTGLEISDRIRVVTWHLGSVQYFFRHHTDRFDVAFSRWAERGNNDWDYAIFTITGMSPRMLRSNMFPPTNTVHQIKVSGVPIAIILKRTDKSDYFGHIEMQEGNLDSALELLKKSLVLVPSSESVLLNISEIYLRRNQPDSAILYLNKLLAFDPTNEVANLFKAHALLHQNRLDEAQRYLQIIINYNPKNDNASWLSAQIFAQQGNLILMERTLERALITNANRQQEAFDLMRQAYQRVGMSESDARMA
ncbi:MAG: tetratricopeptide repeat protein, partial [Bacteroidales bacterium]|nr:tetratricopeptide repeat protein [Bacteroidales bacterium]